MRAAMITRYQQPLEIVNLADPKLPKDGIIMRVRATGVCRSDWHTWMGHYADQITLPLIPGHEMAGDVVEVGSDVTGLVPGDRVTVPFGLACGRCYTCLDGNHQSCITQVQPSTDFNGSFAELIELLTDIRLLIESHKSTEIPAAEVLSYLVMKQDSEWFQHNRGKPITQKWLSRMLQGYGVYTERRRHANVYEVEKLQEAFLRYLP